ncbi:MAG: exonuclease subunit SbcD [Actinomycetota bacterium]
MPVTIDGLRAEEGDVPLRILHTADWHVGRAIARRPRLDEHRAVLAEIAAVARAEEVDVAVVAGDVFDQQNPGAEAERVVYDALADLRDAARHVVVVAGNHDSPARWQALRRLADGVAIVARPDEDVARRVIPVTGADGTRATLLCLPWVPEHRFLTAEDVGRPEDGSHPACSRYVAAAVRDLVAAAGTDPGALVLAAHLFAADAEVGGGERPVTIGGAYTVRADAFPPELAYVALGHIHRSQPVGGDTVRYAGSPLQLDFSERDDRKHVLVVDVGDGPARVRAVPLEHGVRLHRLAGRLADIERLAREGALPVGHVQVLLECDGPEPGLGDRVRDLVPGCVEVRLVHSEARDDGAPPSLAGLSPREMFARYLVERAGFDAADPALLDRFERLLEEDDGEEGDAAEDVAA